MAGNAEILGLGDLARNFKNLKSDMVVKTSRRMVASAGGVLRREARIIAQSLGLKKSGALIRNIAIKRERRAPAGTEQYNLGVRHGRDLGNGKKVIKYLELGKSGRVVTRRANDPFYWKFLEFDIKHRNATPFISKALDNKSQEAITAMEDRLNKDLEKYNKP
ncbi:MAG: HK97 gp10 family phage protein [Nitrosomonas sp.]|uniref:HK97-gp10 family putative phage morphogenesis protein n=1 Tax=Nitrosomonas sp. TaxID=42353 RepID=UPI0025CBEC51|nr:HK97-gp10 family putative phage morphogenesis protein [Nitrosomonas sp.]MBY0474215.1 HK97 gp10 family phage protein [Nitrosomonas sp.]